MREIYCVAKQRAVFMSYSAVWNFYFKVHFAQNSS